MTFEELKKANEGLATMDIKEKPYVTVNARVMAFRSLYPNGTITTDIIRNEDGVVTMQARVMDEAGKLLATGLAYEKETSSYINKTSYIENCETSAVGRALGFLGIGIDTSIASAEEMQNAVNNQGKKYNPAATYSGKLTKGEVENLKTELNRVGWKEKDVIAFYHVKSLGEISPEDYMQLLVNIDENSRNGNANNSGNSNAM